MLLNIKTGWQGLPKQPMNDIVILVSSLHHLVARGIPFVYSDRTATLAIADFKSDMSTINSLPWNLWQADDFRRDDSRPDKIERYLAEALVHHSLPVSALKGIVCYGEQRKLEMEELIARADLAIPVHRRQGWYC
jgi:hypothetical protein